MSRVVKVIQDYYEKRGLKFPDFDNAMKFVHTEIAEVYELDLSRVGGWIRNHPENKPDFDKQKLAEELGDAIMMLLVAGMAEGVDPIDALYRKIEKKLESIKNG
jgi:NTP pyrophosphatase (non-canonical NTP hydrolase)